jgi:hypothetical protein
MKFFLGFWMFTTLAVAGCGGATTGAAQKEKSEGPGVNTLSHDQLIAIYQECTQYGQIDDPGVPYTPRYCASIQSAHLSEGDAAVGKPKVDPTLNKMH